MKIYLMKTDEYLEQDRFRQACELVDAVRLDKIHSCKLTEDKVRSLCCGLLLQYALKKELAAGAKAVPDVPSAGAKAAPNVPSAGAKAALDVPDARRQPLALHYRYGAHGKPYLTDYPQLYFSLSHSGEYAALAIAACEVGLDIQQKRPISVSMAKRILSEQEYRRYSGLTALSALSDTQVRAPSDTQAQTNALSDTQAQMNASSDTQAQEWLLQCWCAKESYGKLSGKGLLSEPRSITYDAENGRINAAFCRAYTAPDGYALNVCTYEAYERAAFPKAVTYVTFAHIIS